MADEERQRLIEEQAAELEAANDELQQALVSLEERTRAAEASERRIRDLLETITDGFYTLDGDGVVIYANRVVAGLLGLTPEQMVGRNLFDVVPQMAGTDAARRYEESRRTGVGQVYETWVPEAGRWIEIRSFPSPTSYSVFIRDVTERRMAADALRTSEERYRLIGRVASDLIYDWDIRTGAIEFSETLHSRFMHPLERLHASIDWWESLLHPEDRARASTDLQRAIDAGDDQWRGEYRFRKGNGGWAVVVDYGYIVRDDAGKPVRMVGAMRDVTARRQHEEEVRHGQKMEVVGRLASGVAHDFNNLLTAVFGYLDLATHQLGAAHPVSHDLAEVRRAAEQAAALTRQLLAFSRRERVRPAIVHLDLAVEESMRLLTRAVGERVALVVEHESTLWSVLLDAGHAEQIVMNLVLNARDAMPDGGTVTLETSNRPLASPRIMAAGGELPVGEYVQLTVSDTGQGMDAATRGRIFEPFFTTKAPGRGTGLGLATVHDIVLAAGGGIDVESAPGQGTTFTVLLPRTTEQQVVAGLPTAASEAPSAASRTSLSRPAIGGTETVLVVADERAMRVTTQRLLQRRGYTVVTAQHAADALRVLREGGFDVALVVADRRAASTGDDAVRVALEREWARLPMVVIGGQAPLDAPPTAPGPRCATIDKPFTGEALLHAMRRVLDVPAATGA